jgi:hypothetical protein
MGVDARRRRRASPLIFPQSCWGDVGAATTINAYEGGTVLVRAIDGAMTGLAFLDRDLCDVEHAGRCHQADHERRSPAQAAR